jgi:hypothetical protein
MFYAVDIQMEHSDTSSILSSTTNGKRERKHTAQTLPPGITQQMMKKYVVYYREFVNLKNEKRVPREYFKVESHPRLSRPWVSSKSGKISLHEKLEAANQIVTELEATTPTPTTDTEEKFTVMSSGGHEITPAFAAERKYLPKYTTIRIVKQTSSSTTLTLVYDQKDNNNGFRWTCSHTFTVPIPPESSKPIITETSISLEISKLKEKIYEKYAVNLIE